MDAVPPVPTASKGLSDLSTFILCVMAEVIEMGGSLLEQKAEWFAGILRHISAYGRSFLQWHKDPQKGFKKETQENRPTQTGRTSLRHALLRHASHTKWPNMHNNTIHAPLIHELNRRFTPFAPQNRLPTTTAVTFFFFLTFFSRSAAFDCSLFKLRHKIRWVIWKSSRTTFPEQRSMRTLRLPVATVPNMTPFNAPRGVCLLEDRLEPLSVACKYGECLVTRFSCYRCGKGDFECYDHSEVAWAIVRQRCQNT